MAYFPNHDWSWPHKNPRRSMLARFDMHELSLLDSTSAKSHLTVPSRIARSITKMVTDKLESKRIVFRIFINCHKNPPFHSRFWVSELFHKFEVLSNHVIELVLPVLLFPLFPRVCRNVSGFFQVWISVRQNKK